MGRTVSTNLQNLLDLPSCVTNTTLDITYIVGPPSYYFATKQGGVTISGNTYNDDLVKVNEIKQSIGASPDRCIVQIENVDTVFGGEVMIENLIRARAVIGRYFEDEAGVLPSVWEELFQGEFRATDVDEGVSSNEVINDLAAAGYVVGHWNLDPNCQFRFKQGDTCGYSGSETTCNKKRKSLAGCLGKIVTGTTTNEYRFGGMEYPDVQLPGPPSGGGDDGPPDDYLPPCPRLDQYVLVRGMSGLPEAKVVGKLTKRDMLFNPPAGTFHEIASLEIVKNQPIVRVVADDLATSFSSASHRIIRSRQDDRGTQAEDLFAGYSVLTFSKELNDASVEAVAFTGDIADVLRIKMKSGFIYCAGHTPRKFIVCHNNKLPIFD